MPDWRIERETEVVNLGESVFIPDFTIFSPTGNKFLLEIVGFWTPEYLQNKIEKINKANCSNLIIVVDQQLKCTRDDFKGKVLFYKNRIKVEEVIKELGKAG